MINVYVRVYIYININIIAGFFQQQELKVTQTKKIASWRFLSFGFEPNLTHTIIIHV